MTRMVEYRQWDSETAEVRAVDGDGMTFVGYAARFNSRSEDLGFREWIMPGAFTRTLRSRNEIKAFLNHNTDIVLGSTRAGTLRLEQDDRGLLAQISLPDTQAGRDLAVSVARGDVSGMSFGFSVPKGGDSWSDDGTERTLSEIALHEVSPVTGFPAYRATTAAVRTLPWLAHRAGLDVDELADAMAAFQAGQSLTREQAAVIAESAQALTGEPEPVVEQDAERDLSTSSVPLSVLAKQLDLKAKALGL